MSQEFRDYELPAPQMLRLKQLLAALCDENLSDAEAAELQTLLSKSVAARSTYVRYMNMNAGLEWEISSRESIEELVPAGARTAFSVQQRPSHRVGVWSLLAIAGALLIVATLAITAHRSPTKVESKPQDLVAAPHPRVGEETVLVAHVTDLGPGAQWAVTPREGTGPTELRKHDVVCVTEGEICVTFDSGAVVTLYAPAMMEVISPMRGRAIRGRLAANVIEKAQGFTIETPQATVVDLGTVFGVEVGDAGATDVVVFKGAVDLHLDHPTGPSDAVAFQRLTSGEAIRIDKGGTPSRIVSISSDRFSSSAENLARPVLISNVTDNIDRDAQSWNYYEIVHGGMGEDAKAFVDRIAHEWNGLDEKGMPKMLLGGDYVKPFNNDKYSRDLALSVTIDQPCRLYILIDDRVEPPDWLKRDFHDTGFDVGLDVGPFHRVEDGVLVSDRVPGVGAGRQVDEQFSIWERRVDQPQIVQLGSIEADHRYVNMYGIVAVPLEQ